MSDEKEYPLGSETVLKFTKADFAFRYSWRLKPLPADTPLEAVIELLNGLTFHFYGTEEDFAARFTKPELWERV